MTPGARLTEVIRQWVAGQLAIPVDSFELTFPDLPWDSEPTISAQVEGHPPQVWSVNAKVMLELLGMVLDQASTPAAETTPTPTPESEPEVPSEPDSTGQGDLVMWLPCSHLVSHPTPEYLATLSPEQEFWASQHECDGCCDS